METIIGKTKIGGDNPCFIIAEIGINFDGSYEKALALIDSAKKAGASAVKFQLFRADKMYTKKAGVYYKESGEKGDIFELVKKVELPENWIPKLKEYAESQSLEFFSTACDEQSVDMLEKYKVSAYKVASYEITHIPLLRYIARKQKPIIFSCAGANLKEIEDAFSVFKEEGNSQIILNHCIGKYPAPLEVLNLNAIPFLISKFFQAIIGYSDHSLDPVKAPSAAVALGAKAIEKHITLDRKSPGADHYCAIEPEELVLMVRAIRETEEKMSRGEKVEIDPVMLGKQERETLEEEKYIRDFAYRSVFAIKPIKKGELFTKENIAVLRAGNQERGLEPKYFEELIKGKKAINDIQENVALKSENIYEI